MRRLLQWFLVLLVVMVVMTATRHGVEAQDYTGWHHWMHHVLRVYEARARGEHWVDCPPGWK